MGLSPDVVQVLTVVLTINTLCVVDFSTVTITFGEVTSTTIIDVSILNEVRIEFVRDRTD